MSPRQKKLTNISVKIALFVMEDTYTDEPEVQRLLQQAIALCDQAVLLLVETGEMEASH